MIYVTADIVDFVQNTSLTFTPKADERHIRFVVQADINQIDVDFDAAKMKMILNNLLSNAFHFTPEYGEIIVRILMDTTHQNQVLLKFRIMVLASLKNIFLVVIILFLRQLIKLDIHSLQILLERLQNNLV